MSDSSPSKFSCKSQVDAFINHLKCNESLFWQAYWMVMLYLPPNCCPNHARNMSTKEAFEAVEFGYIRINNLSNKNKIDTVEVSIELAESLKIALHIAGDREFLFDAALTGANRSASKGKPVARQSSYRVLARAKDLVQDATRNSGIYEEFNLHQRTILFYDANSVKARSIISTLISLHGSNITPELLVSLKKEMGIISRKSYPLRLKK